MPNSMTKLEINDVLSSIRRLVSGEKAEKKSVDLSHGDFFVLTPAHRIEADTSAGAGLPDLSLPTEPAPVENVAESSNLDILKLTNPAFVDAPESEPNEPAEQNRSEKTAVLMELFPDASAVAETETSNDPEDRITAEINDISKHVSLEDRISELEEAVNRSEEEWEPDGSEDDIIKMPLSHLFGKADRTQNWVAPKRDEPEGQKNLEPTVARPPVVTDKPTKTAALEKAPVPSDTPLQLAEVATFTHVPLRSRNIKTEDAMPPVTAKVEIVEGEDDIFVDEDLLRKVVSDIVRDELQGKLGERITRNIRRMVRREIEQSLQLKNFD